MFVKSVIHMGYSNVSYDLFLSTFFERIDHTIFHIILTTTLNRLAC